MRHPLRRSQIPVQLALTVLCMVGPLVLGADVVDDRLAEMVQENVTDPWPDPNGGARTWGLPCYALACLHLNTNVATANTYINDFYSQFPVPDSDTIEFDVYFKLHLLWRIYCDPTMNARLTATARDNIEDIMWLFINERSDVSQAQGTAWKLHDSENHDAMQKGSYLLCSEALAAAGAPYGPDRELADGNTLAEHAAAWTDYFRRYFPGRAREGMNVEIASPVYAKYSMGVYYNIRDFAGSSVLRELADRFITLYWADTACDWTLPGVRGGAETRCYKENYLRVGSQYSFHELLWGYGWHQNEGTVRTYNLIPAVSSYRVPAIITACATDTNRPGFLYTSRRWGRTSGNDAYGNQLVVFDNGNSFIRRDTYVTPDYALGAITIDMNRDYLQVFDQNRMMGVTFASGVNDRVVVYGKGAGNNKSYADLSGVCREDCMVVQRDKNANSSGNETLVFVSQDLWDGRVETNGWLFVRGGNGFCGVKPAGGGYTAASASRGYDLELGDRWAPVVVQTGQASNYASFVAFQGLVQSNVLTYTSGTLNYVSEAGDSFTVYSNSKTTPKINGSTVNLNPSKTYDSPYLSMEHGSDTATFSYGGYADLVLDFSRTIEPGTVEVLNTGSMRVQDTGAPGPVDMESNPQTLSFDAGPLADKLVVTVSSEQSGDGTISITYNGVALTQAAQGSGRALGIWYLDDPYTGGAADLTVDMTSYSVVNGVGLGVVAIAGAAPGVEVSARATANSVSVATTASNSVVVAGYGENGGGTVAADAPLTEIYSGDIGSALGCAGYHTVTVPGSNTYSFTSADYIDARTVAAVFSPSATQTRSGMVFSIR